MSLAEQKGSDTAAYVNQVEHLQIQIAPLPIMQFFRSSVSLEAYVDVFKPRMIVSVYAAPVSLRRPDA
jgi:hypothetical protein